MENATDQSVAELEEDHGAWQIWVIWKAIGGQIWCARRWDGTGAVINADNPDDLDEAIRKAGA